MIRNGVRWSRTTAAAVLALTFAPLAARAQDAHFVRPIPVLESLLRDSAFEILDWRGSRRPEDRTQRVTLAFADSSVLLVKWANAPRGGGIFNNEPRYEVAAYEIQKLFLDEHEYVVPPTVMRAFPLSFVEAQVPNVKATFPEAPQSVLVALQYWLMGGVRPDNVWQPERMRSDTAYARTMGNLNILTYLIKHADTNTGNFLLGDTEAGPRVFAVDNGVSFDSDPSNRGTEWMELRVDRLPRQTVERLKEIKRQDLEKALGVLAEFEIRDDQLIAVPHGENMSRNRGVRKSAERIQLGLTAREIRAVQARLEELVRMAHGRNVRLF